MNTIPPTRKETSNGLLTQLNASIYLLAAHLRAYVNILKQFEIRKV